MRLATKAFFADYDILLLINPLKERIMKKVQLSICVILLFLVASASTLKAQDLTSFEKKVTTFTLDNGLRFIIIKRDVAPVASFVSFVNAGSVNEPIGKSGEAHVLEHMAFKGTPTIGTTNWEKEKPLLSEEDQAYEKWFRATMEPNPDSTKIKQDWSKFKELEAEAKKYVKNNEFSQIIDRNGGVGMNASTASDQTMFFYSLPANRAQLWFSTESDRFMHPVFREFYKEKNVIMEERRMRTDSNPVGRLIEEFLSVAYTASPYGTPTIGWPSDIKSTTIADVKAFYNKYYVPTNIVLAIAGDVDPAQMKKWAEEYFGRMPKKPEAPLMTVREPEQHGERRFVMHENSQPWYIAGYHTVSADNPDAKPLQLLASILSDGRTSRLYKKMVEQKQVALNVGAFNGFPGDKYQSMFLTYVLPNQGVPIDSVETIMDQEIEKIKQHGVTKEELDRAITNARADLVRSLNSNMGMALALAQAEAQRGDWRTVFTDLDDLEKVTSADIQSVAKKYLITSNRTVGIIEPKQDTATTAEAN